MSWNQNNNYRGAAMQPAPAAGATFPDTALAPMAPPAGGVLTAFSSLPQMLQVADMLASSPLVPKHFANNQGSVLIALNMAQRLGTDPFMVMQNIYVVHGSPSMSGQFAIALLQQSKRYRRIEFKYCNGKNYEGGMFVRGWRADDPKGEAYDDGTPITMELARKEGWTSNSKWSNMTEQMMRYRSASWFARVFTPDELMGMRTSDEVEDITLAEKAKLADEKKQREMKASPAKLAADDVVDVVVETKPVATPTPAPTPEPAPNPTPTPVGDGERFMAMLKEADLSQSEFKKWCGATGIELPPSIGGPKLDRWAHWLFKQENLMVGLYDAYGCVIPML